MTRPLALVFYEKLLPGTQVVNQLQDLNYRVRVLPDVNRMVEYAKDAKPMVVITDLDAVGQNVCDAVAELRAHPDTGHLPVIGFTSRLDDSHVSGASQSGVSLCVGDVAILSHLQTALDQAINCDPMR